MQMLFNANGTLNRAYRPYIDSEELTKVFSLYDPNRPFNYGLYDSVAQPYCSTVQQNYLIDNPSPYPMSSIDGRCNYKSNDQSTLQIVNTVYPKLANQILQRDMKFPTKYNQGRESYTRLQNNRCSCGCVRAQCQCPSGCSCNCNT